MSEIQHNQVSGSESYIQLFLLAEQIAHLLGKMGHKDSNMPVGYNPVLDPDVLTFMAVAIGNEIQAESQQAHELDILDREV